MQWLGRVYDPASRGVFPSLRPGEISPRLDCLIFRTRDSPCESIEWVFRAANFLRYQASEQELVYRILMNFHPSVLAHAAFLERPRSRKELLRVVGLVEERTAIARGSE